MKRFYFLSTLFSIAFIGSDGAQLFANHEPLVPDKTRLKTCYKADAWTCAVESEIVVLVNQLRSQQPLRQNFESSFVARSWSADQAETENISHEGFPQRRESVLASEFPGYKIFFRAENVAMVYAPEAKAKEVAAALLKLWRESEGHRQNMLGDYRYIGAGVSRKDDYVYATQIFH